MSVVHEVPLNLHTESNGTLVVFEEGSTPFPLRRTFVVTAGMGQIRGNHAHKTCSQLLVALRGEVLVSVEDGNGSKEFLLSELKQGLLIPPMTWAKQKYLCENTVLMVLCDQLFDELDYIRDYAEFNQVLQARQSGSGALD